MYCVKFEAERVKEVWILVKDLIQKACDYSDGFADAEDFKKWLEQGTMQLWVAWDSAPTPPSKFRFLGESGKPFGKLL